MRTRYEAFVDDVPLSSVDPAVIVADIAETEPDTRRQTAQYPTGDGQRVLRTMRQALRVTVEFEIHTQDVRRRADICERVVRWAQGRVLKVNYRPEQRLRVICETPPSVTSSLSWTQRLRAVFCAYAIPYWEDAQATRVTVNGNGSQDAYVRGTAARALVEASVENRGNTVIKAVTLKAGDTAFAFANISIPAGGSLVTGYDDERVLSARIGGTSVLARRTTESSDDLLAPCGQRVTFAVSGAGANAKTTFTVRGWYL